jgi:zinc protease
MLAILAATSAHAQRETAAVNIPFERMTLPNGLTVILAPNHSVPQVAVDVWYHVGSKNEIAGHTGFAHMFEHVMFTGSAHVPYGMHDRLTEGVGGNNNGSTTNDRTNFYEIVPSNYLESELWLESDRMGFLLDKLDDAKFRAQRDIVQNERRQGVDNQPYGRSYELMDFGVYPSTNPYSWPVVGYMTDLQAATVEDVKNFFRMYYAPSNATIAIAGDFDPAQARKFVTKYFGDLKRGAPVRRPKVVAPVLTSTKRFTFEDHVQVPRLFITWPSVGDDSEDAEALTMLGRIISGERTARLTKALVYVRQSATETEAFNYARESGGNFVIDITPRPTATLTQLAATTDSVLATLRADGPMAQELEKAKAALQFYFVSGLQSNIGKSDILLDGEVFHGDAGYYKKHYAKLLAITAADVKRVANKYLTSNRVVVSIVPLGKPELAASADSSAKISVSADGGHYSIGGVR